MRRSYWERSDRFDMALDLTAGRRGIAALATAIERWIRHMLSVEVAVEPLREMREVSLTWYVGLDAEGTRIGDALWRGDEPGDDGTKPGRGAVPLDFRPARRRRAGIRRRYGLSHPGDERIDKMLRLKPQNLLTGLPVRRLAPVA